MKSRSSHYMMILASCFLGCSILLFGCSKKNASTPTSQKESSTKKKDKSAIEKLATKKNKIPKNNTTDTILRNYQDFNFENVLTKDDKIILVCEKTVKKNQIIFLVAQSETDNFGVHAFGAKFIFGSALNDKSESVYQDSKVTRVSSKYGNGFSSMPTLNELSLIIDQKSNLIQNIELNMPSVCYQMGSYFVTTAGAEMSFEKEQAELLPKYQFHKEDCQPVDAIDSDNNSTEDRIKIKIVNQ